MEKGDACINILAENCNKEEYSALLYAIEGIKQDNRMSFVLHSLPYARGEARRIKHLIASYGLFDRVRLSYDTASGEAIEPEKLTNGLYGI